jgi:hypothetical protein
MILQINAGMRYGNAEHPVQSATIEQVKAQPGG